MINGRAAECERANDEPRGPAGSRTPWRKRWFTVSKLYHSGIGQLTARSTLADANEKRDWRFALRPEAVVGQWMKQMR